MFHMDLLKACDNTPTQKICESVTMEVQIKHILQNYKEN